MSPGGGDEGGAFYASNRVTQIETSASEPVGKELTPQGYGGYYVVQGDALSPGGSVQRSFSMYTGANKPKVLGQLDPNLTYLVDLGWFAFFGWPLLYMLNMFYGLCGNWGLSIILLTVTVKLLFFPLTQRAFKSSQRMQAIQPRDEEDPGRVQEQSGRVEPSNHAVVSRKQSQSIGRVHADAHPDADLDCAVPSATQFCRPIPHGMVLPPRFVFCGPVLHYASHRRNHDAYSAAVYANGEHGPCTGTNDEDDAITLRFLLLHVPIGTCVVHLRKHVFDHCPAMDHQKAVWPK